MVAFQVFIKFWSSERNTENTMPYLCFNEESDYSEENACDSEVTMHFVLPFSTMEETKHFHASAADLLHALLE